MSATVPQARKQSPTQKGKHMGLGKTSLQIVKNIRRAVLAPREQGAGAAWGAVKAQGTSWPCLNPWELCHMQSISARASAHQHRHLRHPTFSTRSS